MGKDYSGSIHASKKVNYTSFLEWMQNFGTETTKIAIQQSEIKL